MTTLPLTTRRSNLAQTQSGLVADRLRAHGHTVELVVIGTDGDASTARVATMGATSTVVSCIVPAVAKTVEEHRLLVEVTATEPVPLASMPGVVQHTLGSLVVAAREAIDAGVGDLMLYRVPTTHDEIGSGATDPDGILNVALRRLRDELGDSAVLMGDLCLDEFTSHGHCGVRDERGGVDNDATLERYANMAVAMARAGAHVVAPTGMMDGQVSVIREALDEAGFSDVVILARSKPGPPDHSRTEERA